MRIITAVLTMFLMLTGPVSAQDWNCDKPGDLPQMGMNHCSYLDYQKADRALNLAWSVVRDRTKELAERVREYDTDYINPSDSLLKAQRAWIDYRDGHCDTEGAKFAGGSIQPLIINTCKASMTRKRTEELLLLLEEG